MLHDCKERLREVTACKLLARQPQQPEAANRFGVAVDYAPEQVF